MTLLSSTLLNAIINRRYLIIVLILLYEFFLICSLVAGIAMSETFDSVVSSAAYHAVQVNGTAERVLHSELWTRVLSSFCLHSGMDFLRKIGCLATKLNGDRFYFLMSLYMLFRYYYYSLFNFNFHEASICICTVSSHCSVITGFITCCVYMFTDRSPSLLCS